MYDKMEDRENRQDIVLAEIRTDIKYIKEFINCADQKFASKITEKLVYGLVGMALIGIASALLAGVVKAAELIISNI